MPMLLKMTFIAWLDKATGKKPRLVVTGKVETPTSGWSGTLVRAPLQSGAPQTLLLDAQLTTPTGTTTPKIGQIDLRYEEMPAGGYTQVIVRLEGSEVKLPVEGAE